MAEGAPGRLVVEPQPEEPDVTLPSEALTDSAPVLEGLKVMAPAWRERCWSRTAGPESPPAAGGVPRKRGRKAAAWLLGVTVDDRGARRARPGRVRRPCPGCSPCAPRGRAPSGEAPLAVPFPAARRRGPDVRCALGVLASGSLAVVVVAHVPHETPSARGTARWPLAHGA